MQRAKQDLGLKDIYIVLLTAKGQEFDRQKGQEVGADLYMTKPFDPDALLQKARDVLGLLEVPMATVRAQASGGRSRQRRIGARARVLTTVAEALGTPVAVEDADGRLLHGEASLEGALAFPVTHRSHERRVGRRARSRARRRGAA